MASTYLQKIEAKLNILRLKRKLEQEHSSGYVDPPSTPPPFLYHVTKRANLEQIKRSGLKPRVGEVTRAGHGSGATPLVHLADGLAPGLARGKDFIIVEVDPGENDIWYYSGTELIPHDGPSWGRPVAEGDFPVGIEPGDYYSESAVKPKAFYDAKGNKI